jgi:hypothetical protein
MHPTRTVTPRFTRCLRAAGLLGAALAWSCATVWAQTPATNPPVTTTQQISLGQSLTDLTRLAAGVNVGDSLRLATAIEIAGTPMGTSAGGFAFKLDKTTGLEARTATTFGPSFAERAITAGAGNMSVAVSLASATYDKIGDLPLHELNLSSREATNPFFQRVGKLSLVLNSETTVIQTVMGATDNLDIGVSIPMVRVRLDGVSWVQDGNGTILVRGAAKGVSSGLGDVGLMAKYRFFRIGGTPAPDAPVEPDPGGLALLATVRVPTGSRENLRGLGITRALGGLIFSFGRGRLRPHANVGYEWWSKGIDVKADFNPLVTARHHFQYSAGIELEAAPRLTVIVDYLGRRINGAGKLGFATSPITNIPTVTSITYPVTLDTGTLEQSLIPGVKWNLRGKILLAVSGIIALKDSGLYDRFTPVVGLDITF